MSPLAGILALKGWQPYMRRAKVNKEIAFRLMLLEEAATGQPAMHRMVTAYPEVVGDMKPPKIQLIERGTVAEYCKPLEWDDVNQGLLELIAQPVLED